MVHFCVGRVSPCESRVLSYEPQGLALGCPAVYAQCVEQLRPGRRRHALTIGLGQPVLGSYTPSFQPLHYHTATMMHWVTTKPAARTSALQADE